VHLTRIHLTDFKRHASLEVEPAAGLTIVRGPNEAGKSTLQQAILLGLFRKADANRDDLRKAVRWGADGPPVVELDFEADGAHGTLRKRFAGSRGEAELTYAGDTTRDHDRINEVVAGLTGVPTESFFRATASVGHAELAEVAGDEPVIRDRLQQAISGADRGTAQARKKLSAAIHRYRTEGHKNPGLLKVGRERIARLETELAEGDRAMQRLAADRAAWVEASERHEQLDRELAQQRADLAEAERAVGLARTGEEAQARYERLKRAAELRLQLHELHAAAPTSLELTDLRAAVSEAASLELDLSELQAELDAEAAVRSGAQAEVTGAPPRPARWLLLAVGLVAAAAVGWVALGGLPGAAVLVVLLLAAVGALVQGARQATRRRQYGLERQLAEATAAQLQAQEQAKHERQRQLQRQLEAGLASLGVADVEAARSLLSTAEAHHAERSRIEGELDGLGVPERDVERLVQERDSAANEAAQARHALAALGPLADDPARAVRTARRQVEQTTPRRDAARSEADQARGRVDANQVDAEQVAGLAERLAAARERQEQLTRRLAVYQGTLDAIDAAERATLKTAARFLEERMGPSISHITDGRYDEISVDETNLDFLVRVPETGELVDIGQLSQGTADQLFLTARLGLVRLVTMDRRPPLILDDPFVTFDRSRGERALRLVKRVAAEQGFQVLFLTCSDRFDALADKLVLLEGPGADRVLAVPVRTPPPPRPADSPAPLLVFEPDPRPNPDPVAPRRTPEATAPTGVAARPERPAARPERPAARPERPAARPERPAAPTPGAAQPAAMPRRRRATPPPTEAAPGLFDEAELVPDPETGVVDPFGLARADDEADD
jgi:DNA repair exonuclease SbcCD ATPase subunit